MNAPEQLLSPSERGDVERTPERAPEPGPRDASPQARPTFTRQLSSGAEPDK